MKFIKVTAMPCNSDGNTRNQTQRSFYLNIDLIGAVSENNIWLKNSEIICLNGTYFRDFKFVENINPKDL
jgi:hypothetical protein